MEFYKFGLFNTNTSFRILVRFGKHSFVCYGVNWSFRFFFKCLSNHSHQYGRLTTWVRCFHKKNKPKTQWISLYFFQCLICFFLSGLTVRPKDSTAISNDDNKKSKQPQQKNVSIHKKKIFYRKLKWNETNSRPKWYVSS